MVRPSSNQWASPLNVFPKADGSWRVTEDYRRLNTCTASDQYPLPIVEDLLLGIRGKVFFIVDLRETFYQIPIAKRDILKMAITTPYGLFEFTPFSMGQLNAAQSLQRIMDHLLRDCPFARCFLDDIFMVSGNHEQYLQHLRQILRKARLRLNPDKCALRMNQVEYLDYTVSEEGIKPPAYKIQAVESFPKTETTPELRRFLDMFSFYRCWIPKAAEITTPLNDLLKRSQAQEGSFNVDRDSIP